MTLVEKRMIYVKGGWIQEIWSWIVSAKKWSTWYRIGWRNVWFEAGWLDPRNLVLDGLGQEIVDLIKGLKKEMYVLRNGG